MKKQYLAMGLGLLLSLGYQGSTQAAEVMDDEGRPQQVRVMDLEHHFTTNKLIEAVYKMVGASSLEEAGLPEEQKRLWIEELDLDAGRLQELDKAGIDYAHISLTTPGTELYDIATAKEIAIEANNSLAAAIKKHPDRIGGYMSLVPEDVEWSLQEIDRCVAMGLWGWSTMSNYAGKTRLDDPKYLPLLEKLNALKMPIFLHPYFPVSKEYTEAGYCLTGPSFGFTVDTQLTFMRMIYRGIFDKYPDLKIILGHNAEGLAIYIDRVDTAFRQGAGMPRAEFGTMHHEPSYYLKHNLYGDTSGSFSPDVLHFTHYIFGDRALVLGTDHHYENTKAAVDLIVNDKELSFAAKKAILQDNAEALGFGVRNY